MCFCSQQLTSVCFHEHHLSWKLIYEMWNFAKSADWGPNESTIPTSVLYVFMTFGPIAWKLWQIAPFTGYQPNHYALDNLSQSWGVFIVSFEERIHHFVDLENQLCYVILNLDKFTQLFNVHKTPHHAFENFGQALETASKKSSILEYINQWNAS